MADDGGVGGVLELLLRFGEFNVEECSPELWPMRAGVQLKVDSFIYG